MKIKYEWVITDNNTSFLQVIGGWVMRYRDYSFSESASSAVADCDSQSVALVFIPDPQHKMSFFWEKV